MGCAFWRRPMVLWVEAIKLSRKLFRLPTYLLAKMAKSAWHRLGKVPGTDWRMLAKMAKSAWHRVGKVPGTDWEKCLAPIEAVLFGDSLWSYRLRPSSYLESYLGSPPIC
jgi:hypothetical protein